QRLSQSRPQGCGQPPLRTKESKARKTTNKETGNAAYSPTQPVAAFRRDHVDRGQRPGRDPRLRTSARFCPGNDAALAEIRRFRTGLRPAPPRQDKGRVPKGA